MILNIIPRTRVIGLAGILTALIKFIGLFNEAFVLPTLGLAISSWAAIARSRIVGAVFRTRGFLTGLLDRPYIPLTHLKSLLVTVGH